MSRKLLLQDAHGQREFLLVGTLIVGRDPRCEISANDPMLSRQHAEFVETANGVLVRDLHSQNGIKVNDISVKEAQLQSGDTIQIARLNLRFVEDAPAQAQAPSAGADDDRTQVLQVPQFAKPAAPPPQAPAHASTPAHAPAVPAASKPAVASPGASDVTPALGVPAPAARSGAGVPAAPPPVEDERTNIIKRPGAVVAAVQGKAAPPAPAGGGHATPSAQTNVPAHAGGSQAAPPSADGTMMMPSPAHAKAPAAAPPGRGAASPSAPASRGADDPRARSASPSSAASASASAVSVPAQSASARGAAVAKSATPGAAAIAESATDAAAAKVTARKPRGSWAARVLLRVLVLGLVCSLVSAVPLMFWHEQQVSAVGLSRATAMGNWFAAEASAALEKSNDAGPAIDAISREPGVVAARVMTIDGHVIAPASRAAEVVSAVPAVGAAPSDILHQRWARNGDLLEVAQPVATSKNPRAAIVWLTVNPATEYGGSSLVIVAPAVVVAMFAAWIIAMSISRPTLRALGHLNEDVELALSGRLDGVTDPLGAKPVKELADTISYLAARIRMSGLDVSSDRSRHAQGQGPSVITTAGRPGPGAASAQASAHAAAASSFSSPPSPVAPSSAAPAPAAAPAAAGPQVVAVPPPSSGCLVVDTAFRVMSADPTCATLLDTTVDSLVGRHLLDAISDRVLVDAVLGCLSALPPEGARETTATDASGRQVAVTVSRTAKDQPVSITLRAEARSS